MAPYVDDAVRHDDAMMMMRKYLRDRAVAITRSPFTIFSYTQRQAIHDITRACDDEALASARINRLMRSRRSLNGAPRQPRDDDADYQHHLPFDAPHGDGPDYASTMPRMAFTSSGIDD